MGNFLKRVGSVIASRGNSAWKRLRNTVKKQVSTPKRLVIWTSVLGGLLFLWAYVFVPGMITNFDLRNTDETGLEFSKLEQRSLQAARQTVLWIAGGIIAVVTLAFTWLRDRTARERLQIDRDSNYTERYTDAISQVGADALPNRLGGLYALERVAKDSPRDHDAIVSFFAAFVRANSSSRQDPNWSHSTDEAYSNTRWIDASPEDVQSALTAAKHLASEKGLELDLSGSDLRYFTQGQGKLSGSVFYLSDLSGATFTYTALVSANFAYSDLLSAAFENCNMNAAKMTSALLVNTQWTESALERADFSHANFKRATMGDCNLSEATFRETNLVATSFRGDYFTRWDPVDEVSNLILDHADFTGATACDSIFDTVHARSARFAAGTFARTRFKNSSLQDSQFDGVDLREAVFDNCDLRGVKFQNVDLTGTEFTSVCWDEDTTWPPDFVIPPCTALEELDIKPRGNRWKRSAWHVGIWD